MTDIEQITHIIYRFANAFDTKKWGNLLNCLDKTIKYDYSDLKNACGECTREEYVDKRKNGLATLMTQHLFGNIEVITFDHHLAKMQVSAVIFRKKNEEIERYLNTHATYLFTLTKKNDNWLIVEIHQTVLWHEGDKTIYPSYFKM